MVGYEMYCALLERAVRQLKKLPPRESIDVNIDLPGEAYLPRGYVPDQRSKIDLYRRLARLTSESAVDDFASELADRFGPLPLVTAHLVELARLRIWAHRWGLYEIRIENNFVVFGYTSREKLAKLVDRSRKQLRVADQASAYLPLAAGVVEPAALFAEVKSLLRPV
jgi:transcription-repair coupling factor (superfamily II helicase)